MALVAGGVRAGDSISFRGFVDVYYDFDFNTPASGHAQLRAFDGQHDSPRLNLSELSLEMTPAADRRAGFHVDLDYGRAVRTINATEPSGTRRLENVGQAYFSYLAPIGTGLQLDAGKFHTSLGNELVRTDANWNYSRSLLFTLAQPTYHAGIRASYVVSERVALSAHLVNGWNNVRDNNNAKSVGLQATVSPTPSLSIVQTYMGGPEQVNDSRDYRHLADTVITVAVTPKLSLAANYDYGLDSVERVAVQWQGVAAYVRFQSNERLAVSSRWEWYDDRNGFTSGTPQRIAESTLTAQWKPGAGVLTRIEYRRDSSCHRFFVKNTTALIAHQDTLTLGVIYAFSFGKP